MVVSNTVAALSEIYALDGSDVLAFSKSTTTYLLSAMEQCTEWGQVCPAALECCSGGTFRKRFVCHISPLTGICCCTSDQLTSSTDPWTPRAVVTLRQRQALCTVVDLTGSVLLRSGRCAPGFLTLARARALVCVCACACVCVCAFHAHRKTLKSEAPHLPGRSTVARAHCAGPACLVLPWSTHAWSSCMLFAPAAATSRHAGRSHGTRAPLSLSFTPATNLCPVQHHAIVRPMSTGEYAHDLHCNHWEPLPGTAAYVP